LICTFRHYIGPSGELLIMGLSIYNLFKAGLLVMNAVIILDRKRFLSRYGYDRIEPSEGASVRNQIAGFLNAIAYLKVPIIVTNCLVMLVELVAGG